MDNVEEYLSNKAEKLSAKALTPLKSNYRPEIDITEELGEDESSYYQSLTGVLRWIVELGRVDICCEVSMLSSHLALPRCGHLAQVLHMFAYLKSHANSEMLYDPSCVEFDPYQTPRHSGHIPSQSSNEISGKQTYTIHGQGDHVAVALSMMTTLKLRIKCLPDLFPRST